MSHSRYSRRAIITLTGTALSSGCTRLSGSESDDALPVLMSLTVENDTDMDHEYSIRVRYAADSTATPETVFQTTGTLEARGREELDEDWSKEPGRYIVEIAIDGGDRHSEDITDRLTQEERICYHEELSITDDGILSMENVDAACPE